MLCLSFTDCGSNLTVPNGVLTFTTTTFESTASLSCSNGYETNSSTINCLASGNWETPVCTIKGIFYKIKFWLYFM